MSHAGPRAGPVPRHAATIVVVAFAALAGACAGTGDAGATVWPTAVFVEAVTQPPLGARETAYDPSVPAPALRLTDQDGRPFDLKDLRGEPVLVYCGYTHCPDVCPTTLADIRAGLEQSGVDARVVFVTIDPERDDAAAMKQYADYYQAGYIGLTGTPGEIAEAAAAWGVTYSRLPSESASGYAMAHSTDTYLVDATGQLRHHVLLGAGADVFARVLTDIDGP